LAVETAEARLAKAILEADVPLEIFAAREADRREAERAKAELELTAARARLEAATTSGAADLQLASATLAQARERVARVAADLERVSLRAGRDGIAVLTEMPWEGRSPRIGDTVWPGQTIATLPDLSTVVIEARLFDVDEGAITAGLAATVTLDAFPDRRYPAHVRSVDATAREIGRSPLRRAFRVLLSLDAPDPEVLRPGMSARVEVALPPVDEAVLVPRETISWRGAEAWVTPAGDNPTAIELERCDARRCLVRSGPPVGTRLAAAEVTR
jgi:HlyD family secretion protein